MKRKNKVKDFETKRFLVTGMIVFFLLLLLQVYFLSQNNKKLLTQIDNLEEKVSENLELIDLLDDELEKRTEKVKMYKQQYEEESERSNKLLEKNNEFNELVEDLKGKNKKLENSLAQKKKEEKKVSSSTKTTNNSKTSGNSSGEWSTFLATYYDAGFQSTGKNPGHPDYGKTASGRYVKEGVTVAVDPNVIPLGTWLLVDYGNGKVEKRRADDTGGAIKGSKIDIYIPKATSTSGKHNVKVKVLG